MSLHFSDADSMGPLGTHRLLKMLPQVPIRRCSPVDFALPLLALLESTQDQIRPVHEGLAISANMDRPISQGGDNGGGEFCPGGAATITPYGVYSISPPGISL